MSPADLGSVYRLDLVRALAEVAAGLSEELQTTRSVERPSVRLAAWERLAVDEHVHLRGIGGHGVERELAGDDAAADGLERASELLDVVHGVIARPARARGPAGRRELAALTLILDAAKGFAAVMFARWFFPGDPQFIAALAVFLGHCFPVWLGFKGGKGVATFIGLLLGIAWRVGLIFCAVWLAIALAQRYSSLAGITASVTSPIFAYAAWLMAWGPDGTTFAATAAVIAAIVLWKHRTNIGRLLSGTEPKIGSEKKVTEAS